MIRPGARPLFETRPSTLGRALIAVVALAALAWRPAAPDDLRPGEWNKNSAPPGWIVIETKHYQVQSQVSEAKTRVLAGHLEEMLALYQEILPFRKRIKTFVLKIFATRTAMHAYRPGAEGAAAWYSKGERELVSYDSGIVLGERDIPTAIRLAPGHADGFSEGDSERLQQLFEATADSYTFDVARVLAHEGWHQYFHHYTVSWVPMPSWLDEGLGDYFYTATRHENDEGYRLGDINDHRLRTVKRALDTGATVPFEHMLQFEQADYYTNPSVYYAQGWSMVHFLMQHEDEEFRKLIPRLIKDFKDSKNFRKSSEKVLKKIDLEELDRNWIRWLLVTEPYDPLRELAREFGDRIRPEDLHTLLSWQQVYAWHYERQGWSSIRAPR